jgi:hypothetical protein
MRCHGRSDIKTHIVGDHTLSTPMDMTGPRPMLSHTAHSRSNGVRELLRLLYAGTVFFLLVDMRHYFWASA